MKVLNFREVFRAVFTQAMSGGRNCAGGSTIGQDLPSIFIYPFTNDNKCLHRAPRDFCQDSKYFTIFYHCDYFSHIREIYAIRILTVKYTQCVYWVVTCQFNTDLTLKKKVTFDKKLRTAEYYLGHSGPIKIEIDRVLGIGEFTTSSGLLSEDYNLVLIAPKIWFAIPMDSDGITDLIKWLEVEFKTEIKTVLANSVFEKSRLIYPEQLRDKEFIRSEQYIPKEWLDNLKVRLGIKPDKILKLHTDISEILKTGM